MSIKTTSLRVKIFVALTLITAISSSAMIFFGMKISASNKELQITKAYEKKIEVYAKEIGEFRSKINSQKKAIGGSNVDLNPTELSNACGRNNAILDKTTPMPNVDREDYLEVGYRVNLNSISRIDLSRLYADLELNIPGCKIKTHSMSVLKNGTEQWSVSFVIVKSVPKIQ